MKTTEIFEKYAGRNIRIGGHTGFFYCGKADAEGLEKVRRISCDFVAAMKSLKAQYNKELDELHEQLRNARTEAEALPVEHRINEIYNAFCYKASIEAKPLISCEVTATYRSICDPRILIFIIDSPILSRAWDENSYLAEKPFAFA